MYILHGTYKPTKLLTNSYWPISFLLRSHIFYTGTCSPSLSLSLSPSTSQGLILFSSSHTWRTLDSNAGRVTKVRILVTSIKCRTGCTHSMDSCLLQFPTGIWWKSGGKIMAASPKENNKSEKVKEKHTWNIMPSCLKTRIPSGVTNQIPNSQEKYK